MTTFIAKCVMGLVTLLLAVLLLQATPAAALFRGLHIKIPAITSAPVTEHDPTTVVAAFRSAPNLSAGQQSYDNMRFDLAKTQKIFGFTSPLAGHSATFLGSGTDYYVVNLGTSPISAVVDEQAKTITVTLSAPQLDHVAIDVDHSGIVSQKDQLLSSSRDRFDTQQFYPPLHAKLCDIGLNDPTYRADRTVAAAQSAQALAGGIAKAMGMTLVVEFAPSPASPMAPAECAP